MTHLASPKLIREKLDQNFERKNKHSTPYEDEKKIVELDKLKTENQHLKDIAKVRNKYLRKIYKSSRGWCFAILIIVCLNKIPYWKLDNNILIALITSTTASIFALMYIVAKWLFPNK